MVVNGVLKQHYDLWKDSLDPQNTWLHVRKAENACNGLVPSQQLIWYKPVNAGFVRERAACESATHESAACERMAMNALTGRISCSSECLYLNYFLNFAWRVSLTKKVLISSYTLTSLSESGKLLIFLFHNSFASQPIKIITLN